MIIRNFTTALDNYIEAKNSYQVPYGFNYEMYLEARERLDSMVYEITLSLEKLNETTSK